MSNRFRNKIGQFVKIDKVKLVCPICNKEFEAYPSSVKRGRKCCSVQCGKIYNKGKPKLGIRVPKKTSTCKICGIQFEHNRWVNREFCSHSCANSDRTYPNRPKIKTTKVQKLRRSKAYKEWRKSIFERDNRICQNCGKEGGFVHAHHIIDISQNFDLALDINNGITLCFECHQKEHPNITLTIKGQ